MAARLIQLTALGALVFVTGALYFWVPMWIHYAGALSVLLLAKATES